MIRLSETTKEVRTVRRLLTVTACLAAAVGTCAGASALHIAVAVPVQAQAPDARTVRISSGVMAGHIQSKVAPHYPEEAKAKHLSGSVVMRAVIGKDGLIRELEAVSGPEVLRESALEAVKQWTYKPYLLNGEPTEVETTITVNYSLESPAPAPPSN